MNNPLIVAGTPDEQMRALREYHREQLARAIVAKMNEIPRSELNFEALGGDEHTVDALTARLVEAGRRMTPRVRDTGARTEDDGGSSSSHDHESPWTRLEVIPNREVACREQDLDGCVGAVRFRPASYRQTPLPRCDKHWRIRLTRPPSEPLTDWGQMDRRELLPLVELEKARTSTSPGVYARYRYGGRADIGKAGVLQRRLWENHLRKTVAMTNLERCGTHQRLHLVHGSRLGRVRYRAGGALARGADEASRSGEPRGTAGNRAPTPQTSALTRLRHAPRPGHRTGHAETRTPTAGDA